MHTGIWLMRVVCPECKQPTVGFVGDNEDGSFYCQRVVIERGMPTVCGESWEKLHHMPEGCVEQFARIDFQPLGLQDERALQIVVQKTVGRVVSVLEK